MGCGVLGAPRRPRLTCLVPAREITPHLPAGRTGASQRAIAALMATSVDELPPPCRCRARSGVHGELLDCSDCNVWRFGGYPVGRVSWWGGGCSCRARMSRTDAGICLAVAVLIQVQEFVGSTRAVNEPVPYGDWSIQWAYGCLLCHGGVGYHRIFVSNKAPSPSAERFSSWGYHQPL